MQVYGRNQVSFDKNKSYKGGLLPRFYLYGVSHKKWRFKAGLCQSFLLFNSYLTFIVKYLISAMDCTIVLTRWKKCVTLVAGKVAAWYLWVNCSCSLSNVC